MTGPALAFDHYDWAGGRESLLHVGDGDRRVVILPALFEEANRTRAITLSIARALAEHDVASAIPDLPGQGESEWPTEHATLAAWRDAVEAAVATVSPVAIVSLRGGALLDGHAAIRWRLSPADGATIVRDLMRVAALSGGPGDADPVEIAGNRIARALLADLAAASPEGTARTVRLDTDPRPADRKLPGAPLWRASEPTDDRRLATLLADDIADWITRCAA